MLLNRLFQKKLKNFFDLTGRELEILILLFNGVESNDEIAILLRCAKNTVLPVLARPSRDRPMGQGPSRTV